MENTIIYEQPLNERIRTFLRLEYLFDTFSERLESDSIQNTRDGISTLIDISELLSRFDVKSEIIKELEKHGSHLKKLINNPNVDQQQLSPILDDIEYQSHQLHNPDYQPGKIFNSHELIMAVKQRSVITGGGCNFDLPGYHHWLNRSVDDRKQLVDYLYTDLAVIDKSIRLCLMIVRNSSGFSEKVASNGFYQQTLDANSPAQMLRILLQKNEDCFPEVSAGKHRFSIRFMQIVQPEQRPQKIADDLHFHLGCCE